MGRHAISAIFLALILLTIAACRKTATWSDFSPHKSGFLTPTEFGSTISTGVARVRYSFLSTASETIRTFLTILRRHLLIVSGLLPMLAEGREIPKRKARTTLQRSRTTFAA